SSTEPIELEISKKDSLAKSIILYYSPAPWDQENSRIASFFDSTAIGHSIASLMESRSKLDAIIKTSVDGIITITERGIIETFNLAAANLFEYSEEEVVGKNIKVLMPEPHRTQHDQYLRAYKETRKAKIIGIGREVQGRKKSGELFTFRLSISELMGLPNKMYLGTIHDVSDRIKAEEVAHVLSKERELSELKSRFVSMASHEFRTPMSSISTSAALIAKYTQDDQQDKREKHVKRILGNIKHLDSMIADFLDLSRMDEGYLKNQPALFNASELSASLVEEMQQSLAENGPVVSLEFKGSGEVFLDEKLFKAVLHNLLSNALKYTAVDKKVLVSLSSTESSIELAIRDEGIGIPLDDQKQLFGRFFRASNVENIKGTGLGLNLVQRYIDLMGGFISYKSELGKGSTFTCNWEIKDK
ncbi:PAS domain-containing sensor histidine kinase, partial [Chitinophagales bacterium]|nr:PAS domain-containing sensor histidine kinase [Chitinophagales bacterium]